MGKIASRGPDDKKIYISVNLCLGHTRLSVIDKESRMQPMSSSDEYYTIIFNGKDYNYVALRKDLKTLGVNFYTNSDTEVSLKSYIVWGKDLVISLLVQP